ncbi:hypothetical protein [Candidatus Aalborgicola defluviihabitans]|uniref:hypothetical protein n=1 Tax=Candidatus Aalborgicola defluviihabitans TaxID=3386187 RepID=UPI001DC9FCB4|nr:hypothetical protein [Burkholderiales bacterium]
MSKLIALVAVLIVVDGVRTTINPGEEVIGLNALDEAELTRIGAVQDTDKLAADDKAAVSAEKKAAQDYARERKLETAKTAAAGMSLQT